MLTKATDPKLSVKDVDTVKGIVTGYFSTYGVKDSDGDIILPGAFTKTVAEQGPLGKDSIKHLRQHDRNQLVGRILKLNALDPVGLYFESEMSKTQLGQDTLMLYQEGILNQHSIGFRIPQNGTRYDQAQDAWLIGETMLREGSVVTWGANPETPVTGIKAEMEQLERIESFLKHGKATDETFVYLQQLKAKIESLLVLKAAQEPDKSTPTALEKQAEEVSDILSYFNAKAK